MSTGVVLVAFNSGPLLQDCIRSLQTCEDVDLRILVVDNGSTDDSIDQLRQSGLINHEYNEIPTAIGTGEVALWNLTDNHGFAGGVNHGLRTFMGMEDVDYMWILNPDAQTLPQTPAALEARARELGRFGIIGGRVCYGEDRNIIQSDGGYYNRLTGICSLRNNRKPADQTPLPREDEVDFVFGAHMFVSKDYVREVGYMPEDYFLYYEETDWCLKRGDLTIHLAPEAVVYHVGGASIGSKTTTQAMSPLSSYFMARSRLRFMRKFHPAALPFSFLYTLAKAMQLLKQGNPAASRACLRALLGLGPDAGMRAKIGPKAVGV